MSPPQIGSPGEPSWVRIDKSYCFETDLGTKTLGELFDGRSRLLVFHFMFSSKDAEGCRGCSFMADHLEDAVVHLEQHGVTFLAASRRPLERLESYKRRMGWRLPWVSSLGSDFNTDFAVFTEEERRTGTGAGGGSPRRAGSYVRHDELHGLSAFALEGGVVYHTDSCQDRGTNLHGN
jgi:predicted dithiol-disulfide oxidoreductase (DUF899 family)